MSDDYPRTTVRAGRTWVLLAADHAVMVDSPRIKQARFALLAAGNCPPGEGFAHWQERVMIPLRDELRDAITERTNELMKRQP